MEVLSPGKKHTQALEMVSEEEEEVEAAESEHEEGEICTEEEEEEEEEEDRRTNKKFPSPAVASEVIYDDNGRTAIFTSPKKRLSSYPRRSEGSRQHGRDGQRRKDKVERGRRHHSSSAAVPEKWPKVTRRTDGKSSGVSEDVHSHSHKGKEGRGSQKVRRSRQSSPESTSGSSSSSSCSCSSSSSSSSVSYSLSEEESDVASVSPCKGRGKENRRCGPSSKGHDRSPPVTREYGCDRPPSKVASKVAGHRTKHSSSQHRLSPPHTREPRRRPSHHHNIRRSPKARATGKASHHRTHQKPSKLKSSERKEAAKTEKPAKEAEGVGGTAKGQNWLPRGSLGEMLLSRPKVAATHPTPATTQSVPRVPAEGPKAPTKAKQDKTGEAADTKPAPAPAPAIAAVPAAPTPPAVTAAAVAVAAVEATRELPTLDQEDDEELQLRYIAIQSSLRLLTDMQKEGHHQEKAGKGVVGPASTDKAGAEATVSQEEVEFVPVVQKGAAHLGSYTPPLGAKREVAEMERMLGEVLTIQSTDDIISISSSSSSDICLENLATNKSYLLATVGEEEEEEEEEANEVVGEAKGGDEARRKARERPDVDQDPVDMEICDSSGEDEGGVGTVEVVRDSPLSPEVDQDAGQIPADPPARGEAAVQGGEGIGSGNFQIPVEWAYMVPPPPPPDQPANDLQNISSWCYDQNMYLQSMQAAPAEHQQHHHHQQQQHQQHQQQLQHHHHHQQQDHQQHQQHQQQQQQHSQPDMGASEWVPSQSLTAPWPPPFIDSYDSGHPSGVADNTGAGDGMGLHHQQQQQQQHHHHHHNYAPPEVPPAQETGGEQSKDLRDTPAEHYQAFMSAVLQQQSPKPKSSECPQRNLILVPLSGTHHSKASPAAAAATKKAKVQKQRAKKRRLKKQRAQENLQQVTTSGAQVAAAAEEEEDEEDEDLLRAQLLIDMSRKKEQRINESQSLPPAATTATTALPAPASRVVVGAAAAAAAAAAAGGTRESHEGRASPHASLPSSESLSPVPRNLRMVKSFVARPRSGENSPTHSFRVDLRPGLSDIGGWGLDPKGSKFNYHGTQHDFPHGSSSSSSSGGSDALKVKFPPIKPIIISLRSDSEDSEEEDDTSQGTSSQDSARKEAEAECHAGEPMSQSIDILLKSMRNANPSAKDHDTQAQPKPGPTTTTTTTTTATPTTTTPMPTPAPTPNKKQREVADNTPQVVRHLSRHQQEEYRWLKEQLRKKMLQRKKMQQRPLRAKASKPLVLTSHSPSPDGPRGAKVSASPVFGEDCTRSMSPAKEVPGEAGSEGAPSSARAVTWKNMGLLQIQVSNESAIDTSTESEDSSRGQQAQQSQAMEGYSSVDASTTEDEDEETLRRMALLTQKKKIESGILEGRRQRVVVKGRKAEGKGSGVQSEATEGEDVLEEHAEDGLKGEWMVLDEVQEEGTEGGEEELCIRSQLCEDMMDECREGDATEAVSRSPERPTAGQGVEAWQDAPKEEQQQQQQQQTLVKNAESKEVSKGDAQTNDTPTDPCQAPPLDPEGGSSSSSGSNSSVAWEETRDQLPVKTETRQVAEASCYGEKIEEVIRRIESKTRVVREKAGSEGPSLEPKKSSTSTLGSGKVNSASPALAMERKEVELQGKEGSRIKTNEGDTGQAGTPHPVTEGTTSQPVKPSTGTTTAVTSPSVDAKTTEKKEVKAVSQRIVVLSNTSALARRKVKVVRAAATDEPRDEPAKETSHAGHGVTPMANGTVAAPQEAEKLKRMEKDYKEKKNVVNKLKMQLANLLNEVKEEQRQRHELKKSVGELRARLKDMETQLESKSSSVQTKIEVVRRLQQQTHKEQQALIQLEHQGERIGKRIHGNGYSFPMVLPSSPNSKTKEAHIAKSLASSIAALQQQMRNLAKRKNNLASGVTNGGETRVVRALTLDPKKESIAGATGNEKSEKAAPQVSQGKAPPDPAGKPQGKAGAAVVKRKLVSSGVVGSAKVAKVEVPMESSAIQERRVPSVTVPIKPKDDKLVEEKLDEMKALCPHDLLGRCNDSACQYQHLPSARPSLPPATRGSLSGADPPTASAVKRASDVKTGAGVKIVPRGSDVKGGFTAAGRTVRVAKATKTVVKAVACESSVRQVTGSSVSGPEQTIKIPVTETHATPHQTNTLTATHPHTPATHHTDTHANTNTQTPPTHQQTQTHTSQETETHTTTHTHQLTEAQDSRELFTLQNDTATPRATEDKTESHTETHSEAKDSEGTIEPQDQSEIQTQMPSTAPQESEMQETHAEEGRKDTALQNKAAFKTLSDPQTQTTTYREINTEKPGETRTPAGEGTETQGSVDNAGQEWKATDDKLSSSNTTVTETEVKTEKPVKAVQADTCTDSREEAETQDLLHTAEGELKAPEEEGLSASTAVEDKPSDNTPGMPQKPSKTTKSRVTRSRTVTKSNAEDTVPSDSQDTDLEKQSVDSVEEEVCTDNQDTRPTRKSPRVRAKTTPKSRTSFDATRTSPRSNKKRKSDNGQRSVKNAKRRASTRL